MKLEDDFEEFDEDNEQELYEQRKAHSQIRSAMVIISVFVFLMLLIILLTNQNMLGAKPYNAYNGSISSGNAYAEQLAVKDAADAVISGSTLTAQDLDFWHDYDSDVRPAIVNPMSGAANDTSVTINLPEEDEEEEGETVIIEPDDPSTDGKHTLITYADGRTEWADINPYLSGNDYDASGFVYQKPFMNYYENNTKRSYVGVDISKEEEFVDFNQLKRAGVDYCMLRLGQRGYTTGEISMDENFLDNYARAREAGLDIGVYFVTSAITIDEAMEEAQYCIQTISENEITLDYPLALYTVPLEAGRTRMDNLEKMPRTNMALTFMKAVEDAGYFSLLYGNKETLIKKYSLGSMIGYEVWYSEVADLPDYPYQYVMWQYDLDGEVRGITGGAHLNVCFVDYSIR